MQIDQEDDSVVDTTMAELILLFVFSCIMVGSVLASQTILVQTPTSPKTIDVFPSVSRLFFERGEFLITEEMDAALTNDVVPNLPEAPEVGRPKQFHLLIVGYADAEPVKKNATVANTDAVDVCTDEEIRLARQQEQNSDDKPDNCSIHVNEFNSNLKLGLLRAEAVSQFLRATDAAWGVEITTLSGGQFPGTLLSLDDRSALGRDDAKIDQASREDAIDASGNPIEMPLDKANDYGEIDNPPQRRVELFLVHAPTNG